jgi:hypothetical protein
VIGRWQARSKETWVTVTQPSLPATENVSWVVVGSSDDSLLIARVIGDAIVYPFRTLRPGAETVGLAFEPRKLGTLKGAEQMPPPEPPPEPVAKPKEPPAKGKGR